MGGKVRIGIIGCGGMANPHVERYNAIEGVEVVALSDISQEAMERLVARHFAPRGQRPALYRDYREMVEKEDLDGVSVITPHTTHHDQVLFCLERGLGVLCEKPLATTVREALEMKEAAEKAGRPLLVAFNPPYLREMRVARWLVEHGRLGTLNFIQGYLAQDWVPVAKSGWRGDPALAGGGQLYDSGAHVIAAILWTTDLVPEEVCAYVDNRGLRVDVIGAFAVKFRGDALGTVAISGDTKGFYIGVNLAGTEGFILSGVYGGPFVFCRGGRRIEEVEAAVRTSSSAVTVAYPDGVVEEVQLPPATNACRNLVECIRGEAEPICPAEYGVRMAALLDAVYESARTGKPCKVALKG